MSETTPEPTDRPAATTVEEPAASTVPLEVALAAPGASVVLPVVPAAAVVVPVVAGDRLGVPLGATRVIADYGRPRPSYVFLALVATLTFAADLGSKAWAEHHLDGYTVSEIWKNHFTLLLAKNRGGGTACEIAGLPDDLHEGAERP